MVTVERQTRLDDGAAERFAAIYEASFPASERDETSSLLASVSAGERSCYVALRDGTVIGLAVVFVLAGTPAVLLEYLAVDAEERNAGVGGTLLTHLRTQGGADSGASGMLLEVEPADEVDGEERELRTRRIGFYLRHGASIVECAPRYRAPNLEREDDALRFTLLWLPLAPEAPARIGGDQLRGCVEAILTQSYGLDLEDALVKEVLDDLAC